MSKITDMLFGTHSQRELRRIDPIVKQIESLRPQMIALSDDELRAKTDEFKKRLNEGETLDDILWNGAFPRTADRRDHPAPGTYRRDAYR